MKTTKQVLQEIRNQYADVLADKRECFDLTAPELELGGSPLASLCNEAGYDSLRGYINAGNQWQSPVASVAESLINTAAFIASEALGLGTWDDMDGFLASANARFPFCVVGKSGDIELVIESFATATEASAAAAHHQAQQSKFNEFQSDAKHWKNMQYFVKATPQ